MQSTIFIAGAGQPGDMVTVRLVVPRGERVAQLAVQLADESSTTYDLRSADGDESDQLTFPAITVRADQMGGVPCIRGLRIPVGTVVRLVASGMTAEEVIDALPDLTPDDVQQALQFAAESLLDQQLPLELGT